MSWCAINASDIDPQTTWPWVGGCLGAVAAHLMFGLELLQYGGTARTGFGQWLGEFIATFGLIATILGCVRFKPEALPPAVGLYITSAVAAYVFRWLLKR